MASNGAVQKDEVIVKGVFDNGVDSGKEFIPVLEDVYKLLVDVAKVSSKFLSQNIKLQTTKEIAEFRAELTKANLTYKQAIELQIIEERLKRDQIKTQNAVNQQKKREEREQRNLNSAFKQAQERLAEMNLRYKDMIISGKGAGKEARELKAQIDVLRNSVNSANEATGQHNHKVGQYERALNGLKSTLTQLGVAFGVFEVLKKSFTVISEFSEGTANMNKAIDGTPEEIDRLNKSLLQINTRTSVSEIQKLAVAGGKLDVPKGEIVDFVKSVDKSFVALGDDLEGNAEEIGTTLGKIASTYGDEAKFGIGNAIERIGSTINVLSAKSKAGAGEIVDFTNRLAGVASQANISSTDIAALGALFDESGQSIETSATTLSTLLPAIGKDFRQFAIIAGMPADEFKRLTETAPIEALKAVANGAKSSKGGLQGLSEVLKNYNIDSARGAAIVGVLSSKTERLTELQKLAGDAFKENTSIQQEYDLKQNTLQANVEKLTNAFDKQILGIGGATGASEGLKNTIGFLAENLGDIIKWTLRAAVAFGTLKAVMSGMKLWDEIKKWYEARKAIAEAADETGRAASNTTKFGKALTAIGWTIAIDALIAMGEAIWNYASGALEAEYNQRKFNEGLKEGGKLADDYLKKTSDLVQNKKDERDLNLALQRMSEKEIKSMLKKGQLTQKQYENFQKNSKKTREQYDLEIQTLESARKKDINLLIKKAVVEKQEAEAKLKRNKALLESNNMILNGEKENQLIQKIGQNKKEIALATEVIRKLKEERENESKATQQNIVDTVNDSDAKNNAWNKEKKNAKEKEKVLKDAEDQIKRIVELEKETIALTDEIAIYETQASIQSALDNQLESITQSGEYSIDLIKQLIDEEYKLQEAIINRQYLESVDNANTEQEVINAQKKRDFELGKLEESRLNRSKEITSELENAQLERAQNEMKINAQIEVMEADLYGTKRELREAEKKQIEIDRDAELGNAKLTAEERTKIELEAQLKLRDIEREIQKERLDAIKNFTDAVNDAQIKQANENIKRLDEQISASQKLQNQLREEAVNGSIDAKESLAAQAKAQNEFNNEKIKEQKRIENAELRKAVIASYVANKESGSKNAGLDTLKDKAVLDALLATIPAFYSGTETTVGDAMGAPLRGGRDGYLSWVDGRERILNPQLSAKIPKSMTNETAANVVQKFADGRLVSAESMGSASQLYQPWTNDVSKIEKGLKNVEKAIHSLPQHDIKLGEVTRVFTEVVETLVKGGNTTKSITRIRKHN